MELSPLGELQLPPGHCVKDVTCACFHPLLPTAYIAVKRSVVEYDVLTGVEIGHFPLRLQATHLMFLKSRNAIVVCMIDGSIVVVEVTGGEILAEHQSTKSADAVAFACAELHELQGLPYLFGARMRAPSPVIAVNLFANNKKLISFPAHKAAITCLTVHPTLPLLACSATDGTVRTFQLPNFSLYNVIDAVQDKSGGVRVLCRLQFHSGGSVLEIGSGKTSRKKKSKSLRKSKKLQSLFKDIRLLVVAERSIIAYYDISIPGAPTKLRDYFGSGSTYRDAHFHSHRSDLIYTLDHRGVYKTLFVDPGKVEQAPTALTVQRNKKQFVPNAKAFSLLEDHENIKPHTVRVRSQNKYGHSSVVRSLVDDDGKVSTWVRCTMHSSMPYFLFYGLDLANGRNASLTIHHLDSICNGRLVALPLNTQVSASYQYWHSKDLSEPNNIINGTVYTASGEGNHSIVIYRHEISTCLTEKLMVITPKNVEHCIPERIITSGNEIIISIRSRQGSSTTPFWCRKILPKSSKVKPDLVEFSPGIASYASPTTTIVLGEEGKRIFQFSTEAGEPETHLLKRGLRIKTLLVTGVVSELIYVAHCTDGSGHSTIRIFKEFESVVSEDCLNEPHTIELDQSENLWEVVTENESHQLGILTSDRVLILNLETFDIEASCSPPSRLHSLHWVGRSLMFGSDKNLMSITRNGITSRVASLPSRSTVAAVLSDRVVLCSLDQGSAIIWSKYLNTFPILCRGVLSMNDTSQVRSTLRDIVPRYDCSTVGEIPGLLQQISRRDLHDLASSLSSSSSEWEVTCRLHILNNEFIESLAALKRNVKDASQTDIARVATDLFQACSHAVSVNPHMMEDVLSVVNNHFEVLSQLRKTNDSKTMKRLSELSTNSSVQRLALELSTAMSSSGKKTLLPPRSRTRPEKWIIGSALRGATVIIEDSTPDDKTELEFLTRGSINSYIYHNNDGGGTAGLGGALNHHGEDDDDEGSSEEGSDDGGFQSPAPATAGLEDDGQSNPENEDEIARQQEELRNQYLNSFAGCGEDDDGGEEDEDGFERKNKFKKFTIKKEAIYQPAVLTNISLGFALPTASQGRHKSANESDGSPRQEAAAPSTEALPPSYLGTSADSVCVFFYISYYSFLCTIDVVCSYYLALSLLHYPGAAFAWLVVASLECEMIILLIIVHS